MELLILLVFFPVKVLSSIHLHNLIDSVTMLMKVSLKEICTEMPFIDHTLLLEDLILNFLFVEILLICLKLGCDKGLKVDQNSHRLRGISLSKGQAIMFQPQGSARIAVGIYVLPEFLN